MGDITLRLQDDQNSFDPERESISVIYSDPQLWVIERRSRDAHARKPRPRIFGDFRQMSIFDGLFLAHTNHASGTFVVQLPEATKDVYVRSGNIVYAASSEDDDRLGESLIRAGLINQQQLDEAAKHITPEKRLGKILVEQSLLTPKQLFDGVRRQVSEIVVGLLSEKVGKFAFYEGIDPKAELLNVSLDTQTLLVDGLRRSQYWNQVEPTAPEREVYLTIDSHPDTMGLNPEERRLVALVGEGLSMRHLIELGGLGRMHTYHHVHRLLLRSVLVVERRAPEDQPKVATARRKAMDSMLALLSEALPQLISMLKDAPESDADAVDASIGSYLEGIADSVLGGRVDATGKIDTAAIFDALEEYAAAERVRLLEQACTDLLNFIIFESHHLVDEATAKQVLVVAQKALPR